MAPRRMSNCGSFQRVAIARQELDPAAAIDRLAAEFNKHMQIRHRSLIRPKSILSWKRVFWERR